MFRTGPRPRTPRQRTGSAGERRHRCTHPLFVPKKPATRWLCARRSLRFQPSWLIWLPRFEWPVKDELGRLYLGRKRNAKIRNISRVVSTCRVTRVSPARPPRCWILCLLFANVAPSIRLTVSLIRRARAWNKRRGKRALYINGLNPRGNGFVRRARSRKHRPEIARMWGCASGQAGQLVYGCIKQNRKKTATISWPTRNNNLICACRKVTSPLGRLRCMLTSGFFKTIVEVNMNMNRNPYE